MGVWIEMLLNGLCSPGKPVTPLVGVWIEICSRASIPPCLTSLPLWECGLKSLISYAPLIALDVTPLVGVWIEIYNAQRVLF